MRRPCCGTRRRIGAEPAPARCRIEGGPPGPALQSREEILAHAAPVVMLAETAAGLIRGPAAAPAAA